MTDHPHGDHGHSHDGHGDQDHDDHASDGEAPQDLPPSRLMTATASPLPTNMTTALADTTTDRVASEASSPGCSRRTATTRP